MSDNEEEPSLKKRKKKKKKHEKSREELLKDFNAFVGDASDAKEYEQRLANRAKAEKDARDKKDAAAASDREAAARNALPDLRERSRQDYLKKREQRELDLLRFQIKDEDFMFAGEELTEAERQKTELNKKLLDIATNRVGDLAEGIKAYRMPDQVDEKTTSEREKVLNARYIDQSAEKTEQQVWEEQQIGRVGPSREIIPSNPADECDMLLEDQIEFIENEIMAGKDLHLEPAVAAPSSEVKDARAAMDEVRQSLPIFRYRDDILKTVEKNKVVILVGETGSGKSTQLPQYFYEAGYGMRGKIGITQPRRVAAMSVAARVAQEKRVKLGNEVGYTIRFEDATSKKTAIHFMTDGMLLRYVMSSPTLEEFSIMIIDEAHERSLHTDLLFGLLKDLVKYRDDFRLIICSATLNADKFAAFYDGAPIKKIPGRRFPVSIFYSKQPEADYLDACVVTVLQLHVSQPVPGDILVFLTGQQEIETAHQMLLTRTRGLGTKIRELIICPIYAQLPPQEQAKVFVPTPAGARKVVIATNIAETSLTIDGIRYVIDTGFAKISSYDPRSGVDSLVVSPASKAQVDQRAGRAGRVSAGFCYRLYTKWSYERELDETTAPEIQRTNLTAVVLLLKSIGINDLLGFDFLDAPPAECLIRALEHVYALGALNADAQLTKLGRKMAELPVAPLQQKLFCILKKWAWWKKSCLFLRCLTLVVLLYSTSKRKTKQSTLPLRARSFTWASAATVTISFS